jgi:hypothetical protein
MARTSVANAIKKYLIAAYLLGQSLGVRKGEAKPEKVECRMKERIIGSRTLAWICKG